MIKQAHALQCELKRDGGRIKPETAVGTRRKGEAQDLRVSRATEEARDALSLVQSRAEIVVELARTLGGGAERNLKGIGGRCLARPRQPRYA
jgi:hypothetical protein